MHREVLAERFVTARNAHDDADAALAMDVARELLARARSQPREPANLDVFLQSGDELRDGVIHPLAGRPGETGQLRRVARTRIAERLVRGDPVGELLRERPEVLRAGDEVGLAIDLDEHRALDRDVRNDEPLGSRAPGLGGRGGEALLAKDLARFVEVALRFHERLLAVHHPGAGFGAQVGYELGVDFHGSFRV